jgi:hypothetical protein
MTSHSVNDILSELRSKGVKLEVIGSKIRFEAPRGAMDDRLLAAMRNHKTELIDLLTNPRRSETPHPRYRPAQENAPEAKLCVSSDGYPVYLPQGWAPGSWARCLRGRADACKDIAPIVAKRYREWADILDGGAGRN